MTPIMYTDPDGHIAFFVIPMLIGAVVGAAAGVGIGYLAGYEGTDLIAWGVGGAVIGGVIGAVTGTLISYTATGSFTSSFSQIKSGFAMKSIVNSKLDYLFGKATGSEHNISRSQGLLKELNKIGINDTPSGRKYLSEELLKIGRSVYNTPGRTTVESMLYGPAGGTKMKTIWDGYHLITVYLGHI